MQDECVVCRFSSVRNSINEETGVTNAESEATACSLDMRAGSERHGANYSMIGFDATVRLPIDTVVDERDEILVTKRFGESLDTPIRFNVAGPVQRHATAIRLLLKKVQV